MIFERFSTTAPIAWLTARLDAMRDDRSGSSVVIFALSLIPILMMVGLAIDYSNASRLRSHLGDAIDSAAIAAARELQSGNTNEAELQKLARDMIEANLANRGNGSKLSSFTLTTDETKGLVRIDATVTLDTYLMRIAGYETLDVDNTAVAQASSKNIELIMALDVTGSMNGSKIADLRTAAADLVDILLPAGSPPGNKEVRIGLVPYSQGVNAGPYARTATNNQSNRCATEREQPYQATDTSYVTEPMGTGSKGCPNNQILPMTSNSTKLKQRIAALSATGATAGQTGIGWSWYMLSPKWTSLWPAESAPKPYLDDKNNKVVVLMTDGQFNTIYEKRWKKKRRKRKKVWVEKWDASESGARARQLCVNMKKKNYDIIIYSVAFKAPTSAKNLLKFCATDANTHYFDAANGAELRAAFRAIANDVNRLRLTQ